MDADSDAGWRVLDCCGMVDGAASVTFDSERLTIPMTELVNFEFDGTSPKPTLF